MIEEIIENKLDYASLLCESDPNINLVENYLRDGRLFSYFEKQTPLAFLRHQWKYHHGSRGD